MELARETYMADSSFRIVGMMRHAGISNPHAVEFWRVPRSPRLARLRLAFDFWVFARTHDSSRPNLWSQEKKILHNLWVIQGHVLPLKGDASIRSNA